MDFHVVAGIQAASVQRVKIYGTYDVKTLSVVGLLCLLMKMKENGKILKKLKKKLNLPFNMKLILFVWF